MNTLNTLVYQFRHVGGICLARGVDIGGSTVQLLARACAVIPIDQSAVTVM